MERHNTLSALLVFAALQMPVATLCMASSEFLLVDGIVQVKDMPMEGTRLVALAEDGSSRVVTTGLARFTMALDLSTTYLLSFEREGCVSKSILFDTHVPDGFKGTAPFDFPFKVTLSKRPGNDPYQYAGPVGFVHFSETIGDFGYDTDYSVKLDAPVFERMAEFQSAEKAALNAGPSAALTANAGPASVVVPIDNDREGMQPLDELAPTLSRVPPGVHLTERTPRDLVHRKVTRPSLLTFPERSVAIPLPAPMVVVAEMAPVEAAATMFTEETIVEKLRVTTITRIQHGCSTTELRRVAHSYGAVFYFKDGVSCSDWTYAQDRQ